MRIKMTTTTIRNVLVVVVLLTGTALVTSSSPPAPPPERFTAPRLEVAPSSSDSVRATSFSELQSTEQPQETHFEFGRRLPPTTNSEVGVGRNEGFLMLRRSRNKVDRVPRQRKGTVSTRPMRKLSNIRRLFRQNNQKMEKQVISERPQSFDVFVQSNNGKSMATPDIIVPNTTASNKQGRGIGDRRFKDFVRRASPTIQIFSAEEDDNEDIIIVDDNGNKFRSDSLEVVDIVGDNTSPNSRQDGRIIASSGLSKLLVAEKTDNFESLELDDINFPNSPTVDEDTSFEGIDFDFDDFVDDDLFDFNYDDFSSLEVPSSFIQQSFSVPTRAPTRAPSPPRTSTPMKVIVVVENNSTHARVQIPSRIMRNHPRQVQALIRKIKKDMRNEKKLETKKLDTGTGSKDRRISQSHQQHVTFTKTNHATSDSFDETVHAGDDVQRQRGYATPRPVGRGASSYSATYGQTINNNRGRLNHQMNKKNRNRTPTSKNMYNTDQKQRADDPRNENSGYQFEYEISEDEVQFGHAENRSGNTVHGEYHVLLPNGYRQVQNIMWYLNGYHQVVTYYADETGYHPTIRYEPPIVHSPRKVYKNPSSRRGVPLTFSDNQHSDNRPSASQDAPDVQETYSRPPVTTESQVSPQLKETYSRPLVAPESHKALHFQETYSRPPATSELQVSPQIQETYSRPPVAPELQKALHFQETDSRLPVAPESQVSPQIQETYSRPAVAPESQVSHQIQEIYSRPPVGPESQVSPQIQETYSRVAVAPESQVSPQIQENYSRPPVAPESQKELHFQDTYSRLPVAPESHVLPHLQDTYSHLAVPSESTTTLQDAVERDIPSMAQSYDGIKVHKDDQERDRNSQQNYGVVIPNSDSLKVTSTMRSLQQSDDTNIGQSVTQVQDEEESAREKQTQYVSDVNENSQENYDRTEKYSVNEQSQNSGRVSPKILESYRDIQSTPLPLDPYAEPRLSKQNSSDSNRITTVGRAIDSFQKEEVGLINPEYDTNEFTSTSSDNSAETPDYKISYTIIMTLDDEPTDTKLSFVDNSIETLAILKNSTENYSPHIANKVTVSSTTESAGIELPILSAARSAAGQVKHAKTFDSDQQMGDIDMVRDDPKINLTSKFIDDANSTQTKRNAAQRNYGKWIPTIRRHPADQRMVNVPHIQSSLRQYSVGPSQKDETPPSANQYTIDSRFWNTNQLESLPTQVPFDRLLRKTSNLNPSQVDYSMELKQSDTKQNDRKNSIDSWQLSSGDFW